MFLLLLFTILVPGIALAVMVVRREQVLLLAMPLALSMYTAIAIVMFKLSLTQWVFSLYFLISGALIFIVILSSALRSKVVAAVSLHWVVLPLLTVVAIYQYIVGPFTDFGVDLYRHIWFVNTALRELISQGGVMKMNLEPGTPNLVFHNVAAYFAYVSGVSSAQLIETIMLVYPLLWTMTVYLFCHALLSMMQMPADRLAIWSVLAVVLYWMTFGINNFSFPRYYLGGPVILTHAMYLAALALCLDLLRTKVTISRLALIGFIVGAMTFLHPQELLLLASSLMAVFVVIVVGAIVKKTPFVDVPQNKFSIAISVLGLITLAGCVIASIYLRPKYAPDSISLLNLGLVHERLIAWNILRPTHQFFTVVGWWGLLILALTILNIRQIKNSAIAVSLLIFPLLTVFNPVFSEAIMKLAYPAVLWRLLFALHLPLLACYLLWRLSKGWGSLTVARKAANFLSIVLFAVLLFPFQLPGFNNQVVKWPSLTRTPVENSWQIWKPLIDFLNQNVETRSILSDPVTGYAIRSLTRHVHHGKKFFPVGGYRRINFDDYSDHPLGRYKGWLLVINTKNGELNQRLKPPYHIYPHVTIVDHYYSDALLKEVSERPDRYRLIWQQNRQYIYEIQ